MAGRRIPLNEPYGQWSMKTANSVLAIDTIEPLVMPDVGLTTSTEPLPKKAKVVIKYSVEVEGMPVYQESYDVAKLAGEIAKDRSLVKRLWFRRVECVVKCRNVRAFSAALTRCLADGKEPLSSGK